MASLSEAIFSNYLMKKPVQMPSPPVRSFRHRCQKSWFRDLSGQGSTGAGKKIQPVLRHSPIPLYIIRAKPGLGIDFTGLA